MKRNDIILQPDENLKPNDGRNCEISEVAQWKS